MARVEEAKLEAWLKRSRMLNKGIGVSDFQRTGTFPHNKVNDNINSCDEPFTTGHVCKKPQLFIMLPFECEGNVDDMDCLVEGTEDNTALCKE